LVSSSSFRSSSFCLRIVTTSAPRSLSALRSSSNPSGA
jgi:hypothetical protein